MTASDPPAPTDIELAFPTLGRTLRAKLTTDSSPDLRAAFLDALPFESIFSHTMSSGYGLYAPTRIVGNFDSEFTLLSELPVGAVALCTDSYKTLGLYYGEITEPLPETLPLAYVWPEDIEDLRFVGEEIWRSNYMTHEPVIVQVRTAGADREAGR
ncbi:MAG: hypothetical protein JST08_07560 [Actinobacteria bacterium]|nr:hypothetical protein [Actinomycetota bacterium]